jgi:hypothetical protein
VVRRISGFERSSVLSGSVLKFRNPQVSPQRALGREQQQQPSSSDIEGEEQPGGMAAAAVPLLS